MNKDNGEADWAGTPGWMGSRHKLSMHGTQETMSEVWNNMEELVSLHLVTPRNTQLGVELTHHNLGDGAGIDIEEKKDTFSGLYHSTDHAILWDHGQ